MQNHCSIGCVIFDNIDQFDIQLMHRRTVFHIPVASEVMCAGDNNIAHAAPDLLL